MFWNAIGGGAMIWRMVSPTLSMMASFSCCSALIQSSRILFLIRATVICDAVMSSLTSWKSGSTNRSAITAYPSTMLMFKACMSHCFWFKTRLKSPRAWRLRAFVTATTWMFNSQGMKLISGSVSRVCLMMSCVSLVEGTVWSLLGECGGILITLLRC